MYGQISLHRDLSIVPTFYPESFYPVWPIRSPLSLPWGLATLGTELNRRYGGKVVDVKDGMRLLLSGDGLANEDVKIQGISQPSAFWIGETLIGIIHKSEVFPALAHDENDIKGEVEWANAIRELSRSLPRIPVSGVSLRPIYRYLQEAMVSIQKLEINTPELGRFAQSDNGVYSIGGNTWVGRDVTISPGVILDSTTGPIIIGSRSKIYPFTYLQGPVVIGKESQLFNLRATGGLLAGAVTRLSGEIESSVVDAFSNKRHDGFLGHSYIGQWVNLGAGTITSDLKNTYGKIRISQLGHDHDTGESKLGAFIGDHVKTGIGTLLSTGTVIGPGSLVTADQNVVKGEHPAFSWLDTGAYDPDRFAEVTKKVMARRNVVPTPSELRRWSAAHRYLRTHSPKPQEHHDLFYPDR